MNELNFKQVIVIRKDLNMRKGKMIAQGAHASEKALFDRSEVKVIDGKEFLCVPLDNMTKPWLLDNFKKIGVSVNSEQELKDIYDKAIAAGLYASLILDSGLTEFDGVKTYTAVAVGPAPSHLIDPITGHLSLI